MKLLYIAGPYRAKTWLGIALNIYRAWRVAVACWRKGYAVICPHTNTLWMSEWPVRLEAHIFLAGDLRMLRRCDAILMLPNWRKSVGAKAEHFYARQTNIPVYYSLKELPDAPPRRRQGDDTHSA